MNREFDIICKTFIIEVKGGSGEKCGKQFSAQKEYCKDNKLDFFVYAPEMSEIRRFTYTKLGFKIFRTAKELIKEIKESNNEKCNFIH